MHATFNGVLRPDQREALEAITKHDFGMLIAPTAFGKTVTAAAIIAKRKVSTLVIVHRADLMRQWQERLGSFVELDEQKIGLIGAGKKQPTGMLDIAVIQSLARHDDLPELFSQYGQVIIDEAHHLTAETFEAVLKQASARYVLGLSATPVRSNGHHPIIFMQSGPVRHIAKRPAHVPDRLMVQGPASSDSVHCAARQYSRGHSAAGRGRRPKRMHRRRRDQCLEKWAQGAVADQKNGTP
ncbi:DEAD/DEAH box helicase [Polaromonas sp. P1(28)-13]|nr:DEAD/DEAH box helicase [Polaromonas sp. P1(28)-13]